jgi:hypothetical protein
VIDARREAASLLGIIQDRESIRTGPSSVVDSPTVGFSRAGVPEVRGSRSSLVRESALVIGSGEFAKGMIPHHRPAARKWIISPEARPDDPNPEWLVFNPGASALNRPAGL